MSSQMVPRPTYANVVGIRMTSTELILDFGCLFGDAGTVAGPENMTPSAQLVLPAAAIGVLSQALHKAFEEHEKNMSKFTSQPKQAQL
jgi:hypothetical protein